MMVELACDRHALDTERKARRQFGEHSLGAGAAGCRVDDETDAMAALDLASCHIHHVAEQPAERRAQKMHDLKAGRREGGGRGSEYAGVVNRHAAEGRMNRARIAHARSLNLMANR